MPWLFVVALFVSAFLLFLVQPMVGKMLLPLMGGTPAVWNTCMVFFQAVLLAGYAYSHATTAKLGSKRQAILHIAVLVIPAIVLPIAITGESIRTAVATEYPVFLLLKILLIGVGLPFFAVTTTGPLLQKWFAGTGHPSARDPYFLYAASNLGSLLALAAYPALVEPELRLTGQSWAWAVGYGVFALLVIACGAQLWKARSSAARPEPKAAAAESGAPPTWVRRGRWVLLAFVPSSLLLGVTTYLSTDIAPIPLLWVIPLALYLLTFVLVFARRPPVPHAWMNRVLPIAVLMLTLIILTGATQLRFLPVGALLALHLFAFFVAAMVAHGELARDRPAAQYLTEFYLWLSVGGVLGGLFNALLAPVLFHRIGLAEYPVAIVLACMIVRRDPAAAKAKKDDEPPRPSGPFVATDVLYPLTLGAATVGLIFLARWLKIEAGPLRTGLTFGLPCLLVYLLVDRPVRYGLGIAAVLLAATVDLDQRLVHLERNFFGVLKVVEAEPPEGGKFRRLYHGNTLHGQQSLATVDSDGRHEPLTYYSKTGPIGLVFEKWAHPRPPGVRVGAVGLGTGSLAYYARPDDVLDFFEIDPAIERVARNPDYFNFMSECRTEKLRVILGDARLRLLDAPDGAYDLLVLDAFSSDAIPTHLLTKEAIDLYRRKLAPGGVIAFHISNRYLQLRPIVAKLAQSVDPPLAARVWDDGNENLATGKTRSEWVVLARSEADFGALVWPRGMDQTRDPRWEAAKARPDTPLWTDDFSNLLSAFDWNLFDSEKPAGDSR